MSKLLGALFAGTFLVGLAAGAAWAADDRSDEGPNFTFGASTSFVYDFNDPDQEDVDFFPGPVGPLNFLSYANQEARDESFNIDLVQLGINGARGNASYGAKIDYGDLTFYAGDDSDADIGLQTAFLSYDFGGAGITAGRFDTPIGYEVLEPWGNAHISRSYSWSLLQPVNHDGLFVSGNVDIVDAMLGVVNGFTVNESGNGGLNELDDEKGIVGAVGLGFNEALNLYFSGIYTEDSDVVDRQLWNAILSGKIPMNGSGMRYAVEANWRDDDQDEGALTAQGEAKQWSVIGYLGADFGPTSLDLRGEYLDQDLDPQDETVNSDFNGQTWSITATAGWYLTDGLQFRVEYRHDDADVDVDGDGADVFADDDNSEDSLDTLQAQVVWYPEL
jgi:hypothetical protein